MRICPTSVSIRDYGIICPGMSAYARFVNLSVVNCPYAAK